MVLEEMSAYERRKLKALPGEARTFIGALATRSEIRVVMYDHGYTTEEHLLGWSLQLIAGGEAPPVRTPEADARAKAAVLELDNWDETGIPRLGAPLERFYPAQHEFVFRGISPARGIEAVFGIERMLDRLDELQNSPDRKATRTEDRAALAKLAERGFDAAERARMRGLVEAAKNVHAPEVPVNPTAEERETALLELRSWYRDWATTARAVITRKDHLIQLGLRKRKSAKAGESDTEELEDVAEEATEASTTSEATELKTAE
jgi:hypothetical protein